jgi:formiminoglutamase
MSGESSSPAAWWSALEPATAELFRGRQDPEDLRLGEVTTRWQGGRPELRHRAPVLIGFACDEGVRRNGGRPGAALAPDGIRQFLYRMTASDAVAGADLGRLNFLDLGNIRVGADLEAGQTQLAAIISATLRGGCVPIVLGGGHETAFGHFLGHVGAGLDSAIINIDAHADVRPYPVGAHSGSPFRQAIEFADRPLGPDRYVVIGAQRQAVARAHADFVSRHGGRVHWLPPLATTDWPHSVLRSELEWFVARGTNVLLTVDADAFRQADVPGVSAPGPVGLDGAAWPAIALLAGANPKVRSIDLVEVNPTFDRDGQSCRWAALGIRQFLVGLALRG